MSFRNAILGMTVIVCVSAATAEARTYVNLDIGLAPPPPRYEVMPEPRYGYVWAPGYWGWDGRRHSWIGGHWVEERPGYSWEPDHWVQTGAKWHYVHGDWREARREERREERHDRGYGHNRHGWHQWDNY